MVTDSEDLWRDEKRDRSHMITLEQIELILIGQSPSLVGEVEFRIAHESKLCVSKNALSRVRQVPNHCL